MGATVRVVASLAFVTAVIVAGARVQAHDCDCADTSCAITCTGTDAQIETDIRNAVDTLRTCSNAQTLRFDTCPAGKVIRLADVSTTATCGGNPETGICVNRNQLTIDGTVAGGGRVTLEYVGNDRCCSDPCDGNLRLFTLRGNNNVVRDVIMRHFPEGIWIEQGNNHLVTDIKVDAMCEDGASIVAGTGSIIQNSEFIGHNASPTSRSCFNDTGSATTNCGTDKAIMLNGGAGTVQGNLFTNVRSPVRALGGGTHTIQNNTATGNPSNQLFCQEMKAGTHGGSTTTVSANFISNTMINCKFGIEVEAVSDSDVPGGVSDVDVTATNNVFQNSHRSAFLVTGGKLARLKGQGNLMINSGITGAVSDPKAHIIVENPQAEIDFGSSTGCSSGIGGTCSSGKNSFCQTDPDTPTDILNTVQATVHARLSCWGDESPVVRVIDPDGSVFVDTAVPCTNAGFTRCTTPPPTPTVTRTGTATHTATNTPLGPTATATRTGTATVTATFTNTVPTPTATNTVPTATVTNTVPTSTVTQTRTPSLTRTVTQTRTPSLTPTITLTPTNTPSLCPAAPLGGCLMGESRKSQLRLLTERKTLKLSWKRGAISEADLGSPHLGDRYAICIYQNTDTSPMKIMEAQALPVSGWKRAPLTGAFKYWSLRLSGTNPPPHGLYKAKLRADTERGQLEWRGKGLLLPLPSTPLSGRVLVQIVRGAGANCWAAEFDTSGIGIRNTTEMYRGNSR